VEDTTWTPDGNVIWNVTSIVDGPGLSLGTDRAWQRDINARNGLIWVTSATDSVDGATDWSEDAIQGATPTGAAAWLADVGGSRTITVTVMDDSDSSGEQTFSFGAGPLSAFSIIGGYMTEWSPNHASDNTRADSDSFQHAANTFPAASFCGGTVNNDVTTAGAAGASDAGFEPHSDGWGPPDYQVFPDGAYATRYATKSGMATTMQLLAVAGYNASYNSSGDAAGRKGAASAADWPPGDFWTGQVHFKDNSFEVRTVSLSNGNTGWRRVTCGLAGPACVPQEH
jgi:hypothetical protein